MGYVIGVKGLTELEHALTMTEVELLNQRIADLEFKLDGVRYSRGLKLYRSVFTAAIARGCNIETAAQMAQQARLFHHEEVERALNEPSHGWSEGVGRA